MLTVLHDLVSNVLEWIQSLGGFGIMIGLMMEMIPSELVLAYGGYLIQQGHISYFSALFFGVAGGVGAQLVIYAIARYGGRPFLARYGKYLLIHQHHIDKSEEWFNKYGTGIIFTARFVPIVRHAISIPAGISRMPVWRFVMLTTLAAIPWTIGFLYLGYVLGERWQHIDEAATPYIQSFILVALAVLIIYFVIKYTMSKKKEGKPI
ncbi:DedA family protein [Paenibacillus sp. SC116]|uniref:DedA family protein n=1 Tax=Paenibacillus sp. SC116 TaxID=2968986 RepID=UPI00215AD78F|nr:DedA family protein [Paenibacillus sp. SC116]MCR8846289.1 DedA family protein [Paenibacillus sp. SC116]